MTQPDTLNPENLYETLASGAVAYATSIVRRRCEAEEIVQEAFCKLLSGGQAASSRERNKALLYRIVRNLCFDRVRENQRRSFCHVEVEQLVDWRNSADDRQLEQLEAAVNEVLANMQTEWSEALHLKVRGGLSYDEIANVLNASHPQVRTWIYRARKQLKAELDQRGLLPEIENE